MQYWQPTMTYSSIVRFNKEYIVHIIRFFIIIWDEFEGDFLILVLSSFLYFFIKNSEIISKYAFMYTDTFAYPQGLFTWFYSNLGELFSGSTIFYFYCWLLYDYLRAIYAFKIWVTFLSSNPNIDYVDPKYSLCPTDIFQTHISKMKNYLQKNIRPYPLNQKIRQVK